MPVSKALRFLLVCSAAVALPTAATAASSAAASVRKTAPIQAEIPFDPPVDRDLRYRWERKVTDKTKNRTSWAVYSLRFSTKGEGYRLVYKELESGGDPDLAETGALDGISYLLNRPLIFDVDAAGVITGMDDAESYWSGIFTVLRQEIAKDLKDEAGKRAMEGFLRTFAAMGADARLAILTQNIQPVTEFAATSTEVGKTIRSSFESETPFGVNATQSVTIDLLGRTEKEATLRTTTRLPEAELKKIMAAMIGNVRSAGTSATLPDVAKLKFDRYLQESVATHQVSLGTGLLKHYRLVKIVEVPVDGKSDRREDVRTLTLID